MTRTSPGEARRAGAALVGLCFRDRANRRFTVLAVEGERLRVRFADGSSDLLDDHAWYYLKPCPAEAL